MFLPVITTLSLASGRRYTGHTADQQLTFLFSAIQLYFVFLWLLLPFFVCIGAHALSCIRPETNGLYAQAIKIILNLLH